MRAQNRILLSLFSALPLLWTITILIGSYSYRGGWIWKLVGHFLIKHKEPILFVLPIIYFLLCTPIYAALLTYLKLKNRINNRQLVFQLLLLLSGLLGAYLSIHYDVFGVSGSYID